MRIGICDDEVVFCKKITLFLNAMATDIEIDVTEYRSGEDLLASYQAGLFDAIILDVEMPGLSGLEVAQQIRARDRDVIIAFLTNHSEFAILGYEVKAFRYILKNQPEPLYIKQLYSIINEYRQKHQTLLITQRNLKRQICINSILYLEVFNRKIVLHTQDESIEFYGKITDFENRLLAYDFIKSHKSYLVNLTYVDYVESSWLLMHNGVKIPISRNLKRQVSDRFINYISNR